jgi:response regulator of citrate/malate metabolism
LLIVGMSAKSDQQTIDQALGVGMDLFLTKPFRYEHLEAALKGSRLWRDGRGEGGGVGGATGRCVEEG